MTTTTHRVTGMTCSHCVTAVTQELQALAGVTGVDVDLQPGQDSTVTITSNLPLAPVAVEDAVAEAGYSLSTS